MATMKVDVSYRCVALDPHQPLGRCNTYHKTLRSAEDHAAAIERRYKAAYVIMRRTYANGQIEHKRI